MIRWKRVRSTVSLYHLAGKEAATRALMVEDWQPMVDTQKGAGGMTKYGGHMWTASRWSLPHIAPVSVVLQVEAMG